LIAHVGLARLCSGLALAASAAVLPAWATDETQNAPERRAERVAAKAAPTIPAGLPLQRAADSDAHCEPDSAGHWALYQRLAARRPLELRAMNEERAVHAE
jgi:hypothetical protein